MHTFDAAFQLLEPGETGLFVLSDGRHFELSSANHNGVIGLNEQGRYTVLLLDVKRAGTAEESWKSFAQTWQAPVRYVTRHPYGLWR